MNLTVRGINYVPSQETKDFIDKKLQKLSFADDYLHDLDIAIKRESKGIGFHIDAILHFKWKTEKIVSYDCLSFITFIYYITFLIFWFCSANLL